MPAVAIEFDDIGLTFAPASAAPTTALEAVSCDFEPGKVTALIGPSGCGKSTLLQIARGFLEPTRGTLRFLERANGKATARPAMSTVWQAFNLFPWLTVAQNIRYGLEMNGTPRERCDEIVARLVRTIGLQGFEHRFPRELSGGMKQRVAIARTLAYDPRILLLDEPFGALDALTREGMQDELLRLWQATRKTVVMVTHDVNEAVYLSERVLVMSQRPGRIVQEFKVAIDRSGEREATVLNDDFNHLRNEVWLAVRRQAGAGSA